MTDESARTPTVTEQEQLANEIIHDLEAIDAKIRRLELLAFEPDEGTHSRRARSRPCRASGDARPRPRPARTAAQTAYAVIGILSDMSSPSSSAANGTLEVADLKLDDESRLTGGAVRPSEPPQFRRFMSRSRPIDLAGIDWDGIRDSPMPDDVLRVLTYMQDVESHTVVFPRTFFSRRALEDEYVGPFLVCWLYEEGMHGRALSKFLDCAGRPIPPRTKSRTTVRDRIDRTVTRMMSAAWKDFLALHMAWGAVHECTTIQAYRRLCDQNDHPILNELLRRIIQDEVRHFAFYMWQAEQRLRRPGVARIVRAIMDRLYTPVGASHQPDVLARWVSGFLFNGEEGRAAAKHVDQSIAKLPGFSDATLLWNWLERNVY